MAVVAVSVVIAAPVDEVWTRLADFTAWHGWLPRITATVMDPGAEQGPVGGVRTLTLADGSTVREQLMARDDERRYLAYRIVDSQPFPVRRYVGRVRLDELTAGPATVAHWSGDFDADAVDEPALRTRFAAIYTGFLDALRATCAHPADR